MRYRSLLYGVGLVFALAFAGMAPAHAADGVDHVTLIEGELAPGAARTYQLVFAEGDLRAGWLFALVGQVQAGIADLTLIGPGGEQASHWRWTPTAAPRWDGIALPRDGAYSLRIGSAGDAALRYTLYYDQSCFCSGKKLPLEGGVIIFQASAAPGTRLESFLAMDTTMDTSVQLAYRAAPAGRWPDDYRILPVTARNDTRSGDTYHQESITFKADTADPYYVIVQSRKGTGTVSFVTEEASGDADSLIDRIRSDAPDPLLLIAALAGATAIVALVLGLVYMRRSQERSQNRL